MKESMIFLFTLMFLTTYAQTYPEIITGDPVKDLHTLLESQTVTADIIDGVKYNARQWELSAKIQSSLQSNGEWWQEFIRSGKEGEPLGYHPNLGLTKEEYDEFLVIRKDFEVESTGKEKLEIINENNRITFKAEGRLSIYNDITIDINNNQVLYKEYVLPFLNNVNVEDGNNGLKSKWKGYTWAYEYPIITEETDWTGLNNLNITIVKFTIGQLERNGKIYMQITEQKVESGVKTVDKQIPILF